MLLLRIGSTTRWIYRLPDGGIFELANHPAEPQTTPLTVMKSNDEIMKKGKISYDDEASARPD